MASRHPLLSRSIREYSEANGVTDGSIMAAIISAHTAMNAPRPRPMVPGIAPMWRASSATPAHAPAAATSTSDADGVSCRSPGTVQLILAPFTRPVHTMLPLLPSAHPLCQARTPQKADAQPSRRDAAERLRVASTTGRLPEPDYLAT